MFKIRVATALLLLSLPVYSSTVDSLRRSLGEPTVAESSFALESQSKAKTTLNSLFFSIFNSDLKHPTQVLSISGASVNSMKAFDVENYVGKQLLPWHYEFQRNHQGGESVIVLTGELFTLMRFAEQVSQMKQLGLLSGLKVVALVDEGLRVYGRDNKESLKHADLFGVISPALNESNLLTRILESEQVKSLNLTVLPESKTATQSIIETSLVAKIYDKILHLTLIEGITAAKKSLIADVISLYAQFPELKPRGNIVSDSGRKTANTSVVRALIASLQALESKLSKRAHLVPTDLNSGDINLRETTHTKGVAQGFVETKRLQWVRGLIIKAQSLESKLCKNIFKSI